MIDVKTRKPISKRPLGHKEFNRIPKATRLQLNIREVTLGQRPYGEWRRWVSDHTIGVPTLYHHQIYKHIKVLACDGVHAVVQNYYDTDAPKKEVFFSSCTELKMAETKQSMAHKEKKAKRATKASTAEQIKVEITDDFLKSLLD